MNYSSLEHYHGVFRHHPTGQGQETEMSVQNQSNIIRTWGVWAVMTGALALVLVFVQIVGPTFEQKPSAATQVGEIAGEIKRSAWRSFLGLPRTEPAAETVPAWNYFAAAAPMLGILAVLLSIISGVRRENWRFSAYGTGLGAAAIAFNLIWWLALLVAGVLLLIVIIENIGDIFDF